MCFLPLGDTKDIGLSDNQPTARFDHAATCHEDIPASGREKMYFHLGCHHLRLLWHNAQRGIAGGAVSDGKGQPCMGKTMLLSAAFQYRTTELHLACREVA